MLELLKYTQYLLIALMVVSFLLSNYFNFQLRRTGYFKKTKFHVIWSYLKLIYFYKDKIDDSNISLLLTKARRVFNLFLLCLLLLFLTNFVSVY